MNDTQITLAGWTGGAVTLRELTDGRAVATFRIACTPTRFRDGERVKGTTTWHTVKAWNRLARHVASSLGNGDPVVVHGRLVADVWQRDGKQQTSFEVVATSVGHDLAHGTTVLTRTAPTPDPAPETAPESAPESAPLEGSETAPRRDDASVVEQPVRAA